MIRIHDSISWSHVCVDAQHIARDNAIVMQGHSMFRRCISNGRLQAWKQDAIFQDIHLLLAQSVLVQHAKL